MEDGDGGAAAEDAPMEDGKPAACSAKDLD